MRPSASIHDPGEIILKKRHSCPYLHDPCAGGLVQLPEDDSVSEVCCVSTDCCFLDDAGYIVDCR